MCHGDDARATLWGGGGCVPLRIALGRGPLPTILLACIFAAEGAGGGPELHPPPLPTVAPTRVPTVHSLPPSLRSGHAVPELHDFLGVPAPAPRWRRQLAGPPDDRTRNAASARTPVHTVGLAGCSRVYDTEALAPFAALQSQRQRCEPPERGLSPGLVGGEALSPRTVEGGR
jgi:hypothetical protein